MNLAAVARIGTLALAAAGTLGSPAEPQDRTRFEDLGLEVRVESPWPGLARRGYVPVFVGLENRGKRALDVELTARSMGRQQFEATSRVKVRAGEVASVELFLPAFLVQGGGYSFSVRAGGDTKGLFLQHEFGTAGAPLVHPVLVVSEERASSATLDEWTKAFSWTDVEIGGNTVANVSLAAVDFDRLPGRLEPYTSLDALVLDSRAVLDGAALGPAFQWARLGGLILVLGPSALARASSMPELAEWMEPRFMVSETTTSTGFRMGLGHLFVLESDAFPGANPAPLPMMSGWLGRRSLVPDPFLGPTGHQLVIPGVGAASPRILIVLMVLFAIGIGPVNFLLVRRSGKPARLLLTVPLLSVGASLVVLGYGFVSQGVGVRASSLSFTMLDQRAHRADVVELRSFFAALSPGDGLTPGPASIAFLNHFFGDELDGLYRVEFGPDLLLTGDFLPARRACSYVALTESAARPRLAFRRGQDGLEVENGLPVQIDTLFVRDPDGDVHALAQPLPAGAKGSLDPSPIAPSEILRRLGVAADFPFPGTQGGGAGPVAYAPQNAGKARPAWSPFLSGPELPFVAGIPPASFLAVVAESPFDDDLGLVASEELGFHVILGIAEEDGETWR